MSSQANANPARRFAKLQGLALVLALAAAACSSSDIQKPGPQSIVGMSAVGTISLTEYIAGGAAAGKGTLNFQGRLYSFKLAGGVTGGGGASDMHASGEVYNLNKLSDFAGLYTQNSGGIGIDTSSTSDLWLRNRAGVILHLTGTDQGITLSLGREEVLIEML